MNGELKNAITILLIMVALIFITFIGGFVVCTLVIFDVIETSLTVKILSYIVNILISAFFGMFIFDCLEGGKKDDSTR
jgi:hypothetical protein